MITFYGELNQEGYGVQGYLPRRNGRVYFTRKTFEEVLSTDQYNIYNIQYNENIYLQDRGTITISKNALNFNNNIFPSYMKWERDYTTKDLPFNKVYYFITDIQFVNDSYVLAYEVDIWHTSIGQWSAGFQIIERATNIDVNRPHALIIPYEMKQISSTYELNNTLRLEGDRTVVEEGVTKDLFYLVIEGYQYELTTGEAGNIVPFAGFVRGYSQVKVRPCLFTLEEVRDALSYIVKKQGQENLGQELRYKITKSYILKANLISDNVEKAIRASGFILLASETGKYFEVSTYATTILTNIFLATVSYADQVQIESKNFYAFTYGSGSTQEEIPNDGLIHEISMKFVISQTGGMSIQLFGINKVKDITNDFLVEVNFDQVDGSVIAQRSISSQTAIGNGFIKEIGGFAKAGLGVGASIVKPSFASAGDIISGFEEMGYGITQIVESAYPRFNSYYENNYSYSGVYNVILGISLYLAVPSNIKEVEETKNNLGYKVYYLQTNVMYDNLPNTNGDIKWQYRNGGYQKLSYVDIMKGSIPDRWIEDINRRLLQGVFYIV